MWKSAFSIDMVLFSMKNRKQECNEYVILLREYEVDNHPEALRGQTYMLPKLLEPFSKPRTCTCPVA